MYVILGATGNTGSIIAENLLKAGKQVTVVGRDAAKLQRFKDQGASKTDLSMNELTAIIGKGIGKPELPYITFSREDELAGMLQNGMSTTIAQGYSELFNALNDGSYQDGYTRTAENTTPTSAEWFIENEFKHAFLAS